MYKAIAPAIMSILASRIMTIHSNLKHTGRIIVVPPHLDIQIIKPPQHLSNINTHGKEYIYFQTEGETVGSAQGAKSISLAKVTEKIFKLNILNINL